MPAFCVTIEHQPSFVFHLRRSTRPQHTPKRRSAPGYRRCPRRSQAPKTPPTRSSASPPWRTKIGNLPPVQNPSRPYQLHAAEKGVLDGFALPEQVGLLLSFCSSGEAHRLDASRLRRAGRTHPAMIQETYIALKGANSADNGTSFRRADDRAVVVSPRRQHSHRACDRVLGRRRWAPRRHGDARSRLGHGARDAVIFLFADTAK